MDSTKIAVVLAVLVGVAVSSPCADLCNNACIAAKTTCDASLVLGPLCTTDFSICTQGCTAICACDDGCGAQCEPAFTDCNTNAHNIVEQGQCRVESDLCIANCEGLCAAQQTNQAISGAVSSILKPAAA